MAALENDTRAHPFRLTIDAAANRPDRAADTGDGGAGAGSNAGHWRLLSYDNIALSGPMVARGDDDGDDGAARIGATGG